MVSSLRRTMLVKKEQQWLGEEEKERNDYVCFVLIVTVSIICHFFSSITHHKQNDFCFLLGNFLCFFIQVDLHCWTRACDLLMWRHLYGNEECLDNVQSLGLSVFFASKVLEKSFAFIVNTFWTTKYCFTFEQKVLLKIDGFALCKLMRNEGEYNTGLI